MNTINQTIIFAKWFAGLRDREAKKRILNRIRNATDGSFGNHKSLGEGVYEMKINYGPGYRMYYGQEEKTVYLLIIGGDKRTQDKDIADAKAMWKALKRGNKND